MKKTVISTLLGSALLAFLAGPAAAGGILINELRVDHPGTDVDEYVELFGPAGMALTGVWLVVLGDTGMINTCGVVENAIDLSAFSIQADGLFCLRISTGTAALTGYDATVSGSLENSDNLTFLLVGANTATVLTDLDSAPEDGTLDSTPWSILYDSVALYEGLPPNCMTDEHTYSPAVVGPDGMFSPGHIIRCATGWRIGPFGTGTWPAGNIDTPGGPNDCTVGIESRTWSSVKHVYR